MADKTCERCSTPAVGPCCSSHMKWLCHQCYRRTHFVEVCAKSCTACAAEGLPVMLSRGRSGLMNDDRWRSLCNALECDDGSGLAVLVAAAEELRAEVEIRDETLRVVSEEVAAMNVVIQKAQALYEELIRLGLYKPGEALTSSPLRSDRWPFEVDLMAAVDTYLNATKRKDPIEELYP